MWFYDFEVFIHDWLVVFINPSQRENVTIVNDREILVAFYEKHKRDLFAGFNTTHYDQYIFKGILAGFDPYEINDWIINQGRAGWQYSSMLKQYPLNNYDVMQRTDRGLKTFEGFMGNDIQETSVPFDIKRKLTSSEIAETVKYCTHDVEQTIEVFLRRKSEFDTMLYFIRHFKLPLSDISKTKPQLAAKILGANGKGKTFNDEFDFPIVDCLRMGKYQYIADWYRKKENCNYEKYQENMIAGVPHLNSWGGGHGALVKYHDTGIFLIIDVTAYYPSLQDRFEFGFRVMDHPENFKFIHQSNVAFKRAGDKKARQPFKILDNAISGQMKQSSSMLYDPMSNNAICINGQLLLIDLIDKLEDHCSLIQNNTDGICVKLHKYEDFDLIDDIVYDWECRTGMRMDIDQFHGEIFQKDVNNYLIIDRETGAIKRKGSYVKGLNDLDYDLPIVNEALVQYMVHHTPVEKTILECNDLIKFQQVKKISNKYDHILYGGVKLSEKCVRCFASLDWTDGGLIKVKNDGSRAKIDSTPVHAFLDNGQINGKTCPSKLDKQWYIDIAKKRLHAFGVLHI